MSDLRWREADRELVEWAAVEFREDLRRTDMAPPRAMIVASRHAAERVGVTGIPGLDDAMDLESVKQLGRACREWLAAHNETTKGA